MNDASGSDINDLLGAYALDAVDRDERELVERHLAADPAARAEVDEMRETAAVLASLPVDDEGAPAGLWNRIAGAIGASDESPAAPEPGVVVPLTRRTRSVPMRLAVSVAAAAALIIAVLAVQVATGSPNRAGNIAAAYDHAVASGARTVQLENPSGNVVAEIALQRDGTGYLRSDALGPLPNGNTYQLWAITGSGAGAARHLRRCARSRDRRRPVPRRRAARHLRGHRRARTRRRPVEEHAGSRRVVGEPTVDVTGSSASFGVYVHVPFCAHRCDYCDFATWTDRSHLMADYVDACVADIERRFTTNELPPATSVFFGGGTPSLLEPELLVRVLHAIPCARGAEVTVECNPDSVDEAKLSAYRGAGVDRLSFGVQSSRTHVLAALGRTHDRGNVARAIELARGAGFERVSVDLIYGTPGESARRLADDTRRRSRARTRSRQRVRVDRRARDPAR